MRRRAILSTRKTLELATPSLAMEPLTNLSRPQPPEGSRSGWNPGAVYGVIVT